MNKKLEVDAKLFTTLQKPSDLPQAQMVNSCIGAFLYVQIDADVYEISIRDIALSLKEKE